MGAPAAAESAARVSACVTELLRKQPFFGSLALRLPLRADPSRKTLASDGGEIRYDPGWVAETGAHLIEAAIARVVLACALKHHTRRGGRDPRRWQHASQLVTHALLEEAGFILPPGAESLEGVSVEEAYERLPPPEEDGPGDSPPPPQGGGASTPDGQASGRAGDGNDAHEDPGDSDGGEDPDAGDGPEPESGGAPESDSNGSGEPPSHDPAGTGEVMDAPAGETGSGDGSSAPDHTAEEQVWDEAMHQAASLARAEGKLPGAIREAVRGAHVSRLDWRALLRRFLTDAAKSDYSWNAPNRRFIDSGLYLPSIRSEGMETLAVIVDTSGSLPSGTLAEFWSELHEIATEIEPQRVVVLQVDTAVRDAAEYSAFDLPDEVDVRGRGGTDFRPGFAWLDEQGVQPSVCVYFTDMECSRYPESEPPFPVLWINWSDPPPEHSREPWGERIDIGNAQG